MVDIMDMGNIRFLGPYQFFTNLGYNASQCDSIPPKILGIPLEPVTNIYLWFIKIGSSEI